MLLEEREIKVRKCHKKGLDFGLRDKLSLKRRGREEKMKGGPNYFVPCSKDHLL